MGTEEGAEGLKGRWRGGREGRGGKGKGGKRNIALWSFLKVGAYGKSC